MPTLPLANAVQSGWQLLKRLSQVKPKEPKMTVGLDIGSSAVKAVALGPARALGGRQLLGHHVVGLGESPDTKAPAAIQEVVSALHLPVKTVTLAVSGQWVIIRVVEMPKLAPQELAQALPFEAQRYLPFSLQDVVLDGAILGPAEENKVWVLLVACKRDLLERRINWVKQTNLEPVLIDVDALALANAFVVQADGRKLPGTSALIHVGAQWTNLVVLKGETPFLIRDIPWGSVKLIRHMAEQLGIEESAVSSQLVPGTSVPAPLLETMKVTCEGLTTELQLSFDFFESRFGTPPDQLLLSGGLTSCPGFLDSLKAHLAHAVSSWTPGAELSSQFTIAYGLALRTV